MPERNPDGTFAPGNSGSAGRPQKRYKIPTILERIGEEEIDVKDMSITKLEAVLRKVYDYAFKGQSWAVQFIAERTEGRVPQQQTIEHVSHEPIKLIDYDPTDSTD